MFPHHEVQPDPADVGAALADGVVAPPARQHGDRALDEEGAVLARGLAARQGDWNKGSING